MSPRFESLVTPSDLVRLVGRHKVKVLAWCVLVAGVSVVAVATLPRTYESEAKLFLRLGRETVMLDPTATSGTTIPVADSRENQLNSTRDMLKSRAVLERAVEIVGPEAILGQPSQSDPAGAVGLAKRLLTWLKFSQPVNPTERAIDVLAQSIDVAVTRNSSVIDLRCTAASSKLAQETLQAYLDAYQEVHLAANRTSGSLEFFNDQAAQARQQIDAAAARLRDAKNQSCLVSVAAEQKALQDQLVQIDAASMAADSSLVYSEALIANLRKSIDSLPQKVTTQQTSGFPNVAADSMRQEFFKLQIAARALQAKLGADHPLVKVQMNQVRQLEDVLGEQDEARMQTTVSANASRQSLELELRREEASAAALRAKGLALKEQYAALQQRLRTLNDYEVRIDGLTREVTLAEANYHSYAKQLEQARVVQSLEVNRISSVNVVQPPSFEERPISPKPKMILGFGFVAAVCGCLGLPFAAEQLARAFASGKASETRLGATELATSPQPLINPAL